MKKSLFLIIALTLICVTVAAVNDPARTTTWEVNNFTTWADAHYGITTGGDGKIHIITVSGNVTIPPTAMSGITFGNVGDITVILRGTGTITTSANGSLLRIRNRQTVILEDLTLQGRDGNNSSVVRVDGVGTFHMKGSASVTGNDNSANGGGVFIAIGGTFIMQDNARVHSNVSRASGGGVVLQGSNVRGGGGGSFLMRDNARVENNTANISGGGVVVGRNATFAMEGGIISGNNVSRGRIGSGGGGILIYDNGLFTMYNGTISENTLTGGWGGGVFGDFTMHNGAISNNTVIGGEAHGGAVNGRLVMYDGAISGNTVIASRLGSGGGVRGHLTMRGGTISGNTVHPVNDLNRRVRVNGGGVNARPFIKTGGTIYGNYAPDGLRNIAIGGWGHAVYEPHFGVTASNWRNATAGPNVNTNRLDFWLNEIDITYSVIYDNWPATSLTFTFSEDPGNLFASQITLCENVSRENAALTGSGTTRTLSPVSISGNGIISAFILSIYGIWTGYYNVFLIPPAPSSVTTEPSASTIRLNWDPVSLATGYRVYRRTATGAYTRIGTTSTTSFTDIRRTHSSSFFYRIKAFNDAGTSAAPIEISATTLINNTQRAIAASSDTVVIEWPRDGSQDVGLRLLNNALSAVGDIFNLAGSISVRTHYEIFRDGIYLGNRRIPTRLSVNPSPFLPFVSFTLVQDSSIVDHFIVDTGLSPNTTYNFRVAVILTLELGILDLLRIETGDVMNASVTTLPD